MSMESLHRTKAGACKWSVSTMTGNAPAYFREQFHQPGELSKLLVCEPVSIRGL
jgi:hypothetical protein